jgi:hypothetical protein
MALACLVEQRPCHNNALKHQLRRHWQFGRRCCEVNHHNSGDIRRADRCHYRKLDPNILMMYSSEKRKHGNLPDALIASSDRCVLAQGEVGPHLIIIGSV